MEVVLTVFVLTLFMGVILDYLNTDTFSYIYKIIRENSTIRREIGSCNCNETDILLYSREKVTIEDCITMQEKYGLEAVISSGEILGFTKGDSV